MKFTLSWLKDHLETEASLEEIVQKLTNIGLEVENVDDRKAFQPFTIAKILTAQPHENADKLQVLTVDYGQKQPIQVVCGAPNARAGLIGVFAPVGTYIPGSDITLVACKIRGVDSFGMMCSERELEISNEHDGIIELPQDAPIGKNFAQYAQLDDPIIEISVTPNRADCTSVYGIARDLAAAGLGKLKNCKEETILEEIPQKAQFILQDNAQDYCLGFAHRTLCQIENQPAPDWIQKRLRAIGLRPINLIVDVTNYITFDLGQPLHAFDADKIKNELHIRRAQNDEKFLALNGKEYNLNDEACVIAQEKNILSLSGIMGAEACGCTLETKNVILEAALWDPKNIAKTGRHLNILSDARYRFERGVDPELFIKALDKAVAIITKFTKAKIGPLVTVKKNNSIPIVVNFDLKQIKRLTNLDITKTQTITILTNLGFNCQDQGEYLRVEVPSWRQDISQNADLVEEILRLVGLEKITPVPLENSLNQKQDILTTLQKFAHTTRRLLASRAMQEIINWSFISEKDAKIFGSENNDLVLENPISNDMAHMRPSLLPGLLRTTANNQARNNQDVAFFELGHVYKDKTETGQMLNAAAIRTNTAKYTGAKRFWRQKIEKVDVFDAKEDAFAVLQSCGLDTEKLQIDRSAPDYYHKGRSGAIKLGPKNILGYFGEFHPNLLQEMEINTPLCGFEIFLENIPKPKKKDAKNKGPLFLSNLQPIFRDFAFIVEKNCDISKITKAAFGAHKKYITNVRVFDVFCDIKQLGEDKKSVAIEIEIQPFEQSFTEQELAELSQKIIENVEKSTGGKLRS